MTSLLSVADARESDNSELIRVTAMCQTGVAASVSPCDLACILWHHPDALYQYAGCQNVKENWEYVTRIKIFACSTGVQ